MESCSNRSKISSFKWKTPLFCCVAAWLTACTGALIAFGTFGKVTPDYTLQLSIEVSLCSFLTICLGTLLPLAICKELRTTAFCIVSALLGAITMVGISINLDGFVCNADTDLSHPAFVPYSDSGIQWQAALDLAHGITPSVPSYGYAALTAVFFKVFGISLLPPLVFNALCMLWTCAIVARTCSILIPGDKKCHYAWVGALLFAIVPSIAYYGAMFMKEAPLCLGVAMTVYCIANLWIGKDNIWLLFSLIAGAGLLAVLRPHTLYVMIPGVAFALIHRVRCSTLNIKGVIMAGVFLCIWCADLNQGRLFRNGSDFMLARQDTDGSAQVSMMGYPTVRAYASLIPDYYSITPTERLKYLPLAAAAQYFPPFPWNFNRDKGLGKFAPWSHLSFLWYIVGGLVLGYIIFCVFRRRCGGGLSSWCLWWIFAYVGTAYMSGGSVARYYLPFIPIALPLAVQFVHCISSSLVSRRQTVWYSVLYSIAVCIALISAYNFLEK